MTDTAPATHDDAAAGRTEAASEPNRDSRPHGGATASAPGLASEVGGRVQAGGDAATDAAAEAAAVFVGGGETGAILRTLDWAATPLGPVAGWPQSLRTAISVMLASRVPMMIHWGPELVHFYNDGYAAILQGKHPGALGAPAIDWWPEIWDQIGPIFEAVSRGETTYFEDTLVLPNRRGHVEECYFTFCHNAIRDETGAVGGVFVTAVETTAHVVSQRRLATLQALTARTTAPGVRDAAAVWAAAGAVLAANPHDVPFALLYEWPADDPHAPFATLAGAVGLPDGNPLAPATHLIQAPAGGPASTPGWPLGAVRAHAGLRDAVTVDDPAAAFGALPDAAPGGPWPEPARAAVILPLTAGSGAPVGALVLGVSPRRPLDAEQRAFEVALAEQIAAAFERVRLDAEAHAARTSAEAAAGQTRAVLAQAPVAVVVTEGPEHRFTLVNAQAEAFTRRGDLVGRTYAEAYPELADSLVVLLDRVYVTGKPVVTREARVAFARPGSTEATETGHDELYLDLVFQPLRAPSAARSPDPATSGPVTGVLHFAVDVTEQVRARREVERLLEESERARREAEAARVQAEAATESAEAANRAKSEFLAVMSHELRTPLNAIGGYAELIELGIHGPVTEAQRTALARVQASQRHLLGLIAGVLDYSRVEAGAVSYRMTEVPVGEAVAEAETLIAPQLRAKGLGYAWSGVSPDLCVRADREKLQQVLLNLLGNAVKFTDARGGVPGRVEVACTVEAGAESAAGEAPLGRVRLHVRDTGEGIAPDAIERIFEPFVQVDQRLTRPHAGVGLGLAISRDLARGMGGELTAESTLGEGSTFTLTLAAAR